MDFRIVQALTSPPDVVESTLLDPAFLARMAELPKLGSAEVVGQTRDGSVVRQQVRYLFQAELSGAVTKVVDPARLTWVEDATIDLADHLTRCEIRPDHYANLLSGRYEALLEPAGTGTRRTITGSLKVKVLMVGGRVEKAIVGGLRENADAQAGLIDAFVSG
jgi:hypothetical protein